MYATYIYNAIMEGMQFSTWFGVRVSRVVRRRIESYSRWRFLLVTTV